MGGMKFLITGATGKVGKALIYALINRGYSDIRVLTRDKKRTIDDLPLEYFSWNPQENIIEAGALQGVDVVIHLAGEGVADKRWSEKQKAIILNSRVLSTSLLLSTIQKEQTPLKKFISASAVGIYGNGFLKEVCEKWEAPVHTTPNLKKHILRIGVVLMRDEGALAKMVTPFKLGFGGTLGNGSQYMSWIHIDDLINQMIFLIENECEESIFNGAAPTPVTNQEFTKILGEILNRWTIAPVPKSALKLMLGEMSEMVLDSQKVTPDQFLKNGFKFKFTTLKAALTDLLYYETKDEHHFIKYQFIAKNLPEVFSFFKSEHNLEKITPQYLNFKVLKSSSPSIEKNTIIDYRLSLHGIPFAWRTRINDFKENEFFIDEQLKGPYKKWVHTHTFTRFKNGTLIKDEVNYKLPLGLLGHTFGSDLVQKDVDAIFKFRREAIKTIFK